METLTLEGTDDTPKVILDKTNGTFLLSGRSLPEDSADFFEPLLKWISDYAKDPNPTTDFTFKLEYSNTASSKFVQEILLILQNVKGIKIIWYYHDEDEDVEEEGKELAERLGIPFDFRTY
jgi:hypothetical protein